MKLKLY